MLVGASRNEIQLEFGRIFLKIITMLFPWGRGSERGCCLRGGGDEKGEKKKDKGKDGENNMYLFKTNE
jgi:hypothetical protein